MRFLSILFIALLMTTSVLAQAESETATPPKIVVIGPLSEEIIAALKLSDSRDIFTPPEDLMKHNNSTYLSNAIQKEQPTWALVDEAFADKRLIKNLEKNARVLVVAEKQSIDDLSKQIKEVGAFLEADKQAAKVSKSIVKANKDLQLKLNTVPAEIDMIYVADIDKNNNPVVAGYDTAAEKVMLMAGGFNIVEMLASYKPLLLETAQTLKPKKILVSAATLEKAGGVDAFFALSAIAAMGVDKSMLLSVTEDEMDVFSPDVTKAAFRLARELFPEVDFSDIATN